MSTQDIGQYSLAIRQNGLRLGVNEPLVALGSVDFSGASGFTPGALTLTAAIGSNKVPLTINQNDTTNNLSAFTVTDSTTSNPSVLITKTGATGDAFRVLSSSSYRSSFVRTVPGINGSNPVLWVEAQGVGDTIGALGVQVTNATSTGYAASFAHGGLGNVLILTDNAPSNNAIVAQMNNGTQTITGAVTDGYHAGIRLGPNYSAATAQTVTRHNYLDILNPVLNGVGPAALTDAAVMRFNAAAGTHAAVDAGTTKTSPGTVTQWIKVNVNGTLAYIPSYSSKTS